MESQEIFDGSSSIFIFVLGVIGNLICFLIYSRKKFAKISASFYFKSIAINNCLILLSRLIYFIEVAFGFFIRNSFNLSCIIINYFLYITISISAWIMVFVLFDRFISLKFIKKFEFRNSQTFKWFILISIYLICLFYYIPVILYSYIDYNYLNLNVTICDIYQEQSNLVAKLDLFFSTLIPFTLMIVFTIFVSFILYQSSKRFNSLISATDKKRRNKDFQFGLTTLFLNIIFLLNNLPVTILVLFQLQINYLFNYLIKTLVYLNCALNIFINIFSNRIFRKELFRSLRKFLKSF